MRNFVQEIQQAETGTRAWSLAQKHATAVRPDWEYVKANVMYRAVAAKYAAHPELAAELASTSGRIKASWSTADWQYLNSRILERVREELRPASERNTRRLDALVSLSEPFAQGKDALDELRAFSKMRPGKVIETGTFASECA
eukprot:TRINITY_DN5479_c0_g1_i2.p1 TRINITY_DN5479_c0_g1~~TRINITY_DN5479_c0_g1_i2.p1  ORF type:complete len:143 (+),score=21.43 TRINITY_DN5479_c0_g1_i2:219-647(+)